MTHNQQHAFANLMGLGFVTREAEFLYLVGTNTGVFTAEQYRRYIGSLRGTPQVQLLVKLTALGYIRRRNVTPRKQVILLTHKAFYSALLTPDSRLRRPMSDALLRQRLQYLDYIVSNPTHEFFGPESDKVSFFRDDCAIPEAFLPSEEWQSATTSATTLRHFPERFPVFSVTKNGITHPGIVYGEDPHGQFRQFRGFLHNHSRFLAALPTIRFVYISPSSRRREMAQTALTALLNASGTTITGTELDRYFALRMHVENNTAGHFTRDDYAFWAYARQQFAGAQYEMLYLERRGQMSLPTSFSVREVLPVRQFQVEFFAPFTDIFGGVNP